MLTRTSASRRIIVAASHEAIAHGVRPGITLAEATALCPHIDHAEEDVWRDAQSLQALGRWMMRFSPIVGLAEPFIPHSLLLDVTGCERIFGGWSTLLQRALAAMSTMRITASIAIAPTTGAAWALAYGRQTPSIITSLTHIPDNLAPLPTASLRLDTPAVTSLHHLGIETVGQLMKLPRDALPARFGPILLMRLNQALGRLPEPIAPLPYCAPIEAQIDFDGVVESMEAISIAFPELIARIISQLKQRGCGARRLDLQLNRPYAASIRRSIHLSRPSRDAAILLNLLRCATDNIAGDSGPAERPEHNDGFIGLRLTAAAIQHITDEQIHLLEHNKHTDNRGLDRLIETLGARLGRQTALRVIPVDTYLPESAYRLIPAVGDTPLLRHDNNITVPRAAHRPLRLFHTPLEIRAMVSPSHDRDGRPVAFTHCGQVHKVTHFVGPERIAASWWEGRDKTRDYFDVEDPAGRRFWIFRVLETGKWYLHGCF